MTRCDFLIIGAGIAGSALAYRLAPHGSTILLERETQPGYHTTGRSAATFSVSFGNPVIGRLTAASRAFMECPPEGFAEHPILLERGCITVASQHKASRLHDAFMARKAASSSLTWLDERQVLEQVPVLRPGIAACGMVDPDMKDMDVAVLQQGYLKGASAQGAEIRTDAEVLGMVRSGNVWRVRTRADEFEAPIVVNAAGAWADIVAGMAGLRRIGLVPKRRTVVTFDPAPGMSIDALACIMEIDRDWYFKPDAGRILASPADQTPSEPCDAQPEEIDVAVIMARMEEVLNFPIARPRARWAGLRCFVSDEAPVIGWAPDTEGFFWLAGQGGHGIQSSDAASRLAVSMILGTAIPADIEAQGTTPGELAPDRTGL